MLSLPTEVKDNASSYCTPKCRSLKFILLMYLFTRFSLEVHSFLCGTCVRGICRGVPSSNTKIYHESFHCI
uniref:Uncharacterized protein n=1 Tax=Arundo donax TaxID=35708 RepID=A0A0A9GMW7_ARUDO